MVGWTPIWPPPVKPASVQRRKPRFIAAGFAISMLFADVLNRVDVRSQVVEVMDAEFGKAEEGDSVIGAE